MSKKKLKKKLRGLKESLRLSRAAVSLWMGLAATHNPEFSDEAQQSCAEHSDDSPSELDFTNSDEMVREGILSAIGKCPSWLGLGKDIAKENVPTKEAVFGCWQPISTLPRFAGWVGWILVWDVEADRVTDAWGDSVIDYPELTHWMPLPIGPYENL